MYIKNTPLKNMSEDIPQKKSGDECGVTQNESLPG